MKSKALKAMNEREMRIILDAMDHRSHELKGWDKRQFDLDFEKVKRDLQSVELDGSGMKQVYTSLNRVANINLSMYGPNVHDLRRKELYNLSLKVFIRFYRFQQKNSPLKKAPTAGTVHAFAR
ncbi:hypothetical protein [Alkalicoccobacillus gibsonii]|uniref:hypothetical protein n=1 Tax=Alkalicoccobacillus gibsonii TaxID=79881 RepID=UPI0019322A3A|nr:hypothetical protein [Alkalicoccobacillus gibsonii]MBM0064969.1 hypothetical protein [Alkalicoccobacillus gibsonii]